MSKGARRRFVGLLAVFIVAVAVVVSAATARQAQHAPRTHAQKRLALAADTTVQKGFHAKLPPHISTLLGLSKEEECPVMQSAVRTGKQVQGLDVSVANKNDIVIFVADETCSFGSIAWCRLVRRSNGCRSAPDRDLILSLATSEENRFHAPQFHSLGRPTVPELVSNGSHLEADRQHGIRITIRIIIRIIALASCVVLPIKGARPYCGRSLL